MDRPLIDCFRCRHFSITWDKHFPYGCKAMGFKSRSLPSRDVYHASGAGCMSYREKITPANRDTAGNSP